MKYYLKIDDNEPIEITPMSEVGIRYGLRETTQDDDFVRSYKLSSSIAIAHYKHNGVEFNDFYKFGSWSEYKGYVCFCVSGILKDMISERYQ